MVDRADLIIVNEYEYSQLPQLKAAARGRHLRAKGSALLRHGQQIAFFKTVDNPVSTVGAGDAYCAALTIGLTSGLEPERALRAANAVGAAAVEVASAQPEFDRLATYLPALD